MSKIAAELTTPPGRFVFGDLYEPETEDFDGNPLVIKNGADKGKPTQLFVIGLPSKPIMPVKLPRLPYLMPLVIKLKLHIGEVIYLKNAKGL